MRSNPPEFHPKIILLPIGIIRTPYVEKYHAPRQPGTAGEHIVGIIELEPHRNFEQALQDLEGFERIWVLSWFHRNTDWRPKVLPPRSGRTKRGVYSTRSPHRPNPIGLSLCKLLGIDGLRLRVENPDLLDGTPILDIKPYIPYAEAFPDSKIGWLEKYQDTDQPAYIVVVSDLARSQANWLETVHGIHLLDRAILTLERDPFPHSSRRIKKRPDGGYIMGMKSWRLRYEIQGNVVRIEKIESGYPVESLKRTVSELAPLHNENAHREFHAKWKTI